MMAAEKTRILLVDDRPDGLLALEAVLRSPQYEIKTARSGIEALAAARTSSFAVILLDVQMPGMDGFQTAAEIRRLADTEDTQIIFVTAISREVGFIHRGYEAGGIDYILKPFDPYVLSSKVTLLSEIYRKNREIRRQSALLRESEKRERERRVAELELENLRRYRSLANAIPHIVGKCTIDTKAEYFNHAWYEFTGMSPEDSTGDGWRNAIHSNDLIGLLAQQAAARTARCDFESEVRLRKRDGSYRWHLIRAVTETKDDGTMTGWIGTATDIHDRKENEQKISRLYRQSEETLAALHERSLELEASNRNLEQFAYAASHDMQEPLRTVSCYMELLSKRYRGRIDQDADRYIDHATNAVMRMHAMIQGLLAYARVQRAALHLRPIAVDSLISQVVDDLKSTVSEKNALINFSDLPTVVANADQVRQVFQNLISNSLKFQNDTSTPVIHIGSRQEGGNWLFWVKDNGIGIDPAYSGRIFNIFERLHTRQSYPGTGIGLAICKKIVERHGGRIWMESCLGEGSTFFFTIPMDESFNEMPANSSAHSLTKADSTR